jgi:hypothetical protein
VAILAFSAGVATTELVRSGAWPSSPSTVDSAGAVPTFDAIRFRAEERSASYPEPTFDAIRFRAEERAGPYPEPTFDAVRFRAKEAGR